MESGGGHIAHFGSKEQVCKVNGRFWAVSEKNESFLINIRDTNEYHDKKELS